MAVWSLHENYHMLRTGPLQESGLASQTTLERDNQDDIISNIDWRAHVQMSAADAFSLKAESHDG